MIYLRVCSECGEKREVKSKPNDNSKCKKCADIAKKVTHKRVCPECGDVKEVKFKPAENAKCRSCAIRKTNKTRILKSHSIPKRYCYFCIDCSDIKIQTQSTNRQRCAKCSKGKSRYSNKYHFSFNLMRMVEKEIVDVAIILNKPKKSKQLCKDCAFREIKMKPKKQKKILISKKELERRIELNRKHKEEVKIYEKLEPKAKTKSDEEMIQDYLAKNKVTVIETKYKESC